MHKSILIALLWIIMGTGALTADSDDLPLPVNAENVEFLTSVQTIDFDNLPDDIEMTSGWFALSGDGRYIAMIQRGGLAIFDWYGELVSSYTINGNNHEPGTVLDASFGPDNQTIAALHTDGEAFSVSVYRLGDEQINVVPLPESEDMPARIWLDESLHHVWLEVLALDSEHYVMRVPLPSAEEDEREGIKLPSGPENDSEAYVRIGRIHAPLAVTSTVDGLVRLWNLETGQVEYEVQLEGTPVFGRVNETTGTQMAWRDPGSEGLYLLDFETGENQRVADLEGAYIQAILVSPAADVILGVAIADEPIVIAWDVATGTRTDLGEYRTCSRVPDMIRLSADGTTLVIGCDTGLDIWQIDQS